MCWVLVVRRKLCTCLRIPPPSSGVHIEIHARFARLVRVVPLRCKDQNTRKLGVAVQGTDALNDVPVEHFERLACNDDLAPDETGSSRGKVVVDNFIELVGVLEGEA